MRYLIEAKSKKCEGTIEEFLKKEKTLKLVDQYDPFQKLESEVGRIGVALRRFQKSGIDWDIFNYYLRGRGTSQQTIDAVVGDIKLFFQKVGLLPRK